MGKSWYEKDLSELRKRPKKMHFEARIGARKKDEPPAPSIKPKPKGKEMFKLRIWEKTESSAWEFSPFTREQIDKMLFSIQGKTDGYVNLCGKGSINLKSISVIKVVKIVD